MRASPDWVSSPWKTVCAWTGSKVTPGLAGMTVGLPFTRSTVASTGASLRSAVASVSSAVKAAFLTVGTSSPSVGLSAITPAI